MPAYSITLRLDDTRHRVSDRGELTLLNLMHRLELPVRKACRNGACGVCRCHLLSGTITYHARQPFGLWQKDIAAGYILPCIAYATSDLELDQLALTTDRQC
ncbi:MAG: 2Fe-2S iron-sulfur cluster binding domain-containing protein [Gammaproteobacteria bacterium]|uniref:2Fe-2S iron-sulfur cluster-binding protein n=1 Tax=Pseudomaricurvus alcaniphilus TaxID=1166482 RepID=UPI00140CFEAF|nr:2Fe-2S iron-sulfur cluster binding domain-containing protein [Pseudomaricurvus alcaniphilus]MBR9909780.1 2Fe-2S iron-sulfur cluster binding domain-containing protein [Gammaproteobacteria bacterium]NHN38499.1 2Fe-2S iron-sulfur cluster binding domain-containing protein [Pseudomaricurvus alcaniphilus]